MPYTLILSHSSRAMAMVNQPVLSQELELFLEDKKGSTFLVNPYLYSVNILEALASSKKPTDLSETRLNQQSLNFKLHLQ